jgi:molybdopterin converting factor small subunit
MSFARRAGLYVRIADASADERPRTPERPMAVVRLRGTLKGLADGQAEHAVDGATVGDLLRALERAHPGMAGWVLDERGSIRRHINVFVNGEQEREDAPVAPDDRVDVLPAISGG